MDEDEPVSAVVNSSDDESEMSMVGTCHGGDGRFID